MKYLGPAKPIPTMRERLFTVSWVLTGFAGVVILMLDLLLWRPG